MRDALVFLGVNLLVASSKAYAAEKNDRLHCGVYQIIMLAWREKRESVIWRSAQSFAAHRLSAARTFACTAYARRQFISRRRT